MKDEFIYTTAIGNGLVWVHHKDGTLVGRVHSDGKFESVVSEAQTAEMLSAALRRKSK